MVGPVGAEGAAGEFEVGQIDVGEGAERPLRLDVDPQIRVEQAVAGGQVRIPGGRETEPGSEHEVGRLDLDLRGRFRVAVGGKLDGAAGGEIAAVVRGLHREVELRPARVAGEGGVAVDPVGQAVGAERQPRAFDADGRVGRELGEQFVEVRRLLLPGRGGRVGRGGRGRRSGPGRAGGGRLRRGRRGLRFRRREVDHGLGQGDLQVLRPATQRVDQRPVAADLLHRRHRLSLLVGVADAARLDLPEPTQLPAVDLHRARRAGVDRVQQLSADEAR